MTTQHELLIAALDANGCERIKDFYKVGPVQRAAVESFAAALLESDAKKDADLLLLAQGAADAERNTLAVITRLHAEAAELRAALVGCEKDAGRYRFVRDANRSDVIAFELKHYAMETLDEYVDAAMEGECAAITQAQEVLK